MECQTIKLAPYSFYMEWLLGIIPSGSILEMDNTSSSYAKYSIFCAYTVGHHSWPMIPKENSMDLYHSCEPQTIE